jgi:hypothetical protein
LPVRNDLFVVKENKMKRKMIVLLLVSMLVSTACIVLPLGVQFTGAIDESSQNENMSNTQVVDLELSSTASQEAPATINGLTYPIVDTAQGVCYDNQNEVPCESIAATFNGQDAQYIGNQADYRDNGDGTVTDLVTGLMWQQNPGEKMTYSEAAAGADDFALAGYDDWRLPTVKELYSLILFDGQDVSVCPGETCEITPFIDTRYFDFVYGDTGSGERVIDSQFASSTLYVSTTMNGAATMFGVNFADGRIKGYPVDSMPNKGAKTFFVLYVRGGEGYGVNDFVDNGNGTISDQATGLTWMQADSAEGMDWEDALGYCEALDFAGSQDWRLPNAKELQSIVDYNRSPDTTNSAAIDPMFATSSITNEMGETDYPFFWSSTTHAATDGRGNSAVYVAFGKATGNMNGTWMDVHGAGAQRSDPKSGDASQWAEGHGPQGDAVHIENYVRCVTGGNVSYNENGTNVENRPTIEVSNAEMQMNPIGNSATTGNNADQQPAGGPPQDALDACNGSSEGETCAFITPRGQETGVCRMVQSQELACVLDIN